MNSNLSNSWGKAHHYLYAALLFFAGLKKDMVQLKVNTQGKIVGQGTFVGTRKQETEKERLRQANAMQHNMQNVAERMVADGAGM